MLDACHVEELICLAAAMGREALTERMLQFRGVFPVDFTPSFLDGLSTERLRHVYVALCLQCNQIPDAAGMPVAA